MLRKRWHDFELRADACGFVTLGSDRMNRWLSFNKLVRLLILPIWRGRATSPVRCHCSKPVGSFHHVITCFYTAVLPFGGCQVQPSDEVLLLLKEKSDVIVVVFFTSTDRAKTIPSNIRGCQSGTWSQRGTKVNGSHHGDNPLLGPTGIQIATKSYATLQAMAPTNNKPVHQTSFTLYREQPRPTRIVVAYPRSAFSATNRTNTFQPVSMNIIRSFSRPHIVQK